MKTVFIWLAAVAPAGGCIDLAASPAQDASGSEGGTSAGATHTGSTTAYNRSASRRYKATYTSLMRASIAQ